MNPHSKFQMFPIKTGLIRAVSKCHKLFVVQARRSIVQAVMILKPFMIRSENFQDFHLTKYRQNS